MKETPDTIRPAANDDTKQSPKELTRKPRPGTSDSSDDALDFVVTEAHEQTSDMVGGYQSNQGDLGIESNSELMEQEAMAQDSAQESSGLYAGEQIGDSNPPLPVGGQHEAYAQPSDDSPVELPDSSPPSGSLEKLSEERLSEISEKMRGEEQASPYLTDSEKQALLDNIESVPEVSADKSTGFDNRPIVPPSRQADAKPTVSDIKKLTGEQPPIAKRSRGIAHFAKGYIKIAGEQELHDNDELIINGREYVLRKKDLGSRNIIVVVGVVAAIAMFALGTLLSPNADTGAGSIVGMVLDDRDQPVLAGAAIHFPELGTTVNASGQGFFMSDHLDPGSYKIEYIVDDAVVGTDYATVVDDRITTIIMRPDQPEPVVPTRSEARATTRQQPPEGIKASPMPQAKTAPPPKAKSSSSNRAATTSKWSKLVLAANVENARLSIDGNVLGAGNLTYRKIKPGRHSYVVSSQGYHSAKGTINLTAGKTRTLSVTLASTTPEPKVSANPATDLYNSGASKLKQGNFAAAIADLDQAISIRPNYADAFASRAEANRLGRNKSEAYRDYVRAGDLYRSNNNSRAALSSYSQAIKLQPKSAAGHLGRANLYLSRGEEIAAIADFDLVVQLEKRNLGGYLGLGQARYNQGYYRKAIKHFKDARSLDSKNPYIHKQLMLSYYKAGDKKQVKKSHDKFTKYASAADLKKMQSDKRFVPILEMIEN